MKTIAYVLGDFPVFSETFVGNEVRAVARRGHRVVPIVMRRGRGPAQPEDVTLSRQAVHLETLPRFPRARPFRMAGAQPRAAMSFLLRQKALRRRSLLLNAMRIAAEARSAGATHLHAHFAGGAAAHAIVAARLIGASVSFVCHGHDVYAEPTDLKVKIESADFVVGVCLDMVADLARLAPGARIEHVICGADPLRFRPAGAPKNGRLLFVGRLVEQKGIDDLLAALAAIDRGRRPPLDIVGGGPLLERLHDLARANGLLDQDGVRFLGSQTASWLHEHAPAYEALVAPFKTAPDGSRDSGPLVVKEAMCMALPIISTRYMGVKDTVSPDTGVLVEPGDVGALRAAIVSIMELPAADRAAMGAAGRWRASTLFSIDAQGAALSRLFETD